MLVTGAAFVVNYMITLVLTPFITQTVGTAAYGFVSLAKNLAQYATIITLALNSFASRHIAVAYHNGEMEKANTYFSSTFFGDVLLGGGVLVGACVAIVYLDRLFVIPPEILSDVQWLFLIVFVNFLLVTIFTVYGAGAYIANRLDIVGLFKLISYVVEAVLLLVIYRLLEARVAYVGFGLMAASGVVIASNVWITRRFTPQLRVRRTSFRRQAVKKLVADGVWSSANDLGALLHNGLDLAICNLMLTPLAMGQLAIAKSIDLIFHSLYHLVAQTFQPIFLRSYAENKIDKLMRELKLSMKLSGMMANLAFAGFAALGMAYYRLWIPGEDIALVYRLTVITVLTSVASGSMKPLYYIYTLTVKQKIPCMVTIVTGVMNVLGMVVLLRFTDMGIDAVVWTTAVLVGFINVVSNPVYMAHVLHQPLRTFYPNILRNVLSCAVLTGLFMGLSRLYMPASWPTLILCVILYAGIGMLVHFAVVFTPEEWREVLRPFRKK